MAESEEEARYPCPACGARLYAWGAARHPVDRSEIVLDRCEACTLVVTRAPEPPEIGPELDRLEGDGTRVAAPNRESFQGGLGGPGWAGLEPERRRLHLSPRSAKLLLRKRGIEVLETSTPFSRRSYGAMLLTMINAFTLHTNFARNARAGRLAPASARQRLGFGLDALVSALVAIPLAPLAAVLELAGSLAGRGGELRLKTAPSAALAPEGHRDPAG